jgi:hypothetical protein
MAMNTLTRLSLLTVLKTNTIRTNIQCTLDLGPNIAFAYMGH